MTKLATITPALAQLRQDPASRIRARAAAIGGVEMKIAPRDLPREPPVLGAVVRGSPLRTLGLWHALR